MYPESFEKKISPIHSRKDFTLARQPNKRYIHYTATYIHTHIHTHTYSDAYTRTLQRGQRSKAKAKQSVCCFTHAEILGRVVSVFSFLSFFISLCAVIVLSLHLTHSIVLSTREIYLHKLSAILTNEMKRNTHPWYGYIHVVDEKHSPNECVCECVCVYVFLFFAIFIDMTRTLREI